MKKIISFAFLFFLLKLRVLMTLKILATVKTLENTPYTIVCCNGMFLHRLSEVTFEKMYVKGVAGQNTQTQNTHAQNTQAQTTQTQNTQSPKISMAKIPKPKIPKAKIPKVPKYPRPNYPMPVRQICYSSRKFFDTVRQNSDLPKKIFSTLKTLNFKMVILSKIDLKCGSNFVQCFCNGVSCIYCKKQ